MAKKSGPRRRARRNNVINVYVKTDPKAHYRQGLSLFLVDNDTPGLALRKLDMLGRRATGTYELTFDKVRVPPDRLIGGENNGWDCVMSGLQVERVTFGCHNVGAAQGALDLAVQYAKDRKAIRPPDRRQSGDRAHARRHADRGRRCRAC